MKMKMKMKIKMKIKRGFKGPALKDFLILIVPLHLGVSPICDLPSNPESGRVRR
jgi:hypothetical protein